MFSRRAKYALHACLFLARHENEGPQSIESIAAGEALPRKFIEVILLDLRHARILQSKKGPGGGYHLVNPAAEIFVADIIKAIDGPLIPFRCVAIREDKTCEECRDARLCPIGIMMREVGEQLSITFGMRTLREVADDAGRLELDSEVCNKLARSNPV